MGSGPGPLLSGESPHVQAVLKQTLMSTLEKPTVPRHPPPKRSGTLFSVMSVDSSPYVEAPGGQAASAAMWQNVTGHKEE